MKAAVWLGPHMVRLQEVEQPQLIAQTDALVKVTLSSICGTDLHPYRGHLPGFAKGTVLGHEFTGEVVAVGEAVRRVKPGDRVVASDLIACGSCWFCQRNLHYHCPSASLFGYGEVVGSYIPGGQSEWVRVPFADTTLFPIPAGISDEAALFVGDILATGYASAKKANIRPGDTVLIVGGGPVGLMAAMCAQLYQPKNLFVLEPQALRRQMAGAIGANPLAPAEVQQVLAQTEGRGADVVIEAVGTDEALSLSLELVRAAGTVVCVGAHHSQHMPFDTENAFARELSLHFVVGNPIASADQLLRMIAQGILNPAKIITHRMPLEEVEHAYRLFASGQAVKIVLYPQRGQCRRDAMKRKQVEQQVLKILQANGVDVARATPQSVFGSPELQLNSVQFMKVFVDLENTFQLAIDYTAAISDDKRTLGSLIDYLCEQTCAQP